MKINVLFIYFFGCMSIAAQSISKQVIGSSGATQTNNNLKVSFTLGEPVVGIMTSNGVQLSNGYYPALDMQTLSINEQEFQVNFLLYPNPTSQSLYISHPTLNSFHFQLIDINGKEVFNGIINNNDFIDVTKYPKGVYLVVIENTIINKKNTYKIIKK